MKVKTCSDTPLHNKMNAGMLVLILFLLVDTVVMKMALLTLTSGKKPAQLFPINRACLLSPDTWTNTRQDI
jgi:hypothetical protein